MSQQEKNQQDTPKTQSAGPAKKPASSHAAGPAKKPASSHASAAAPSEKPQTTHVENEK